MAMHQSEFVQFTKCERAWWYSHVKGVEAPPSQAMLKGTMWHTFREWWEGHKFDVPEHDELLTDLSVEEVDMVKAETVDDLYWMVRRFNDWRYQNPTHTQVVETEVELEGAVSTTNGVVPIGGRIDALEEDEYGNLWVGERKTMKDWRRLDYLSVDPQLTHYVLLARLHWGDRVKGVRYEAARTYRWKRDPHPAADSFRDCIVMHTPEQLKAYGNLLGHAQWRMSYLSDPTLLLHPPEPLPNIGMFTCNSCAYKEQCWNDLALPSGDIQVAA